MVSIFFLSNFYYLTNPVLKDAGAREFISGLCEFVEIAPAGTKDMMYAVRTEQTFLENENLYMLHPKMMVTPDPGVIEVNIHPAKSWQEIVDHTTALYEEAFLSRLGTDKFMVDGRHTGTGGGNHVTLGAAKPEDLRFPLGP